MQGIYVWFVEGISPSWFLRLFGEIIRGKILQYSRSQKPGKKIISMIYYNCLVHQYKLALNGDIIATQFEAKKWPRVSKINHGTIVYANQMMLLYRLSEWDWPIGPGIVGGNESNLISNDKSFWYRRLRHELKVFLWLPYEWIDLMTNDLIWELTQKRWFSSPSRELKPLVMVHALRSGKFVIILCLVMAMAIRSNLLQIWDST